MMGDLDDLRAQLRLFADEREWGQFHKPKNLALALAGEVGELCTVLQWLDDGQVEAMVGDAERRQPLVEEMADVLIYLVRLADVCGVDLGVAAHDKIAANAVRYPVELARGNARKRPQRLLPETSDND